MSSQWEGMMINLECHRPPGRPAAPPRVTRYRENYLSPTAGLSSLNESPMGYLRRNSAALALISMIDEGL